VLDLPLELLRPKGGPPPPRAKVPHHRVQSAAFLAEALLGTPHCIGLDPACRSDALHPSAFVLRVPASLFEGPEAALGLLELGLSLLHRDPNLGQRSFRPVQLLLHGEQAG
jgi:hypothetical protein